MHGSNREIEAWSMGLALGVLMIFAIYLPLLSPPQCPLTYTQDQIDSANCIVGANIGAGLLRLLGILVTFVTGAGLLASVSVRVSRKC